MEEVTEGKNKLKRKVSNPECDFLYKSTQMKSMTLHMEPLQEQNRKLAVENESIRFRKLEIIALPMNVSRLKRSVKCIKMIA